MVAAPAGGSVGLGRAPPTVLVMRFLNVPFLVWAGIVALLGGVLVVAVVLPQVAPDPRPYPVSDSENIQRAMSLQSAASALPGLISPKSRQRWCGVNIPLAKEFAAQSLREGTADASIAFDDVATAFTTYCARPQLRLQVGVALNRLSTVVTGGQVSVHLPRPQPLPEPSPTPSLDMPAQPTPTMPSLPRDKR